MGYRVDQSMKLSNHFQKDFGVLNEFIFACKQ
jgi:hypothetical protein